MSLTLHNRLSLAPSGVILLAITPFRPSVACPPHPSSAYAAVGGTAIGSKPRLVIQPCSTQFNPIQPNSTIHSSESAVLRPQLLPTSHGVLLGRHQSEKNALGTQPGIHGAIELRGKFRTRNSNPIGPQSAGERTGLRLQLPTGMIHRPHDGQLSGACRVSGQRQRLWG